MPKVHPAQPGKLIRPQLNRLKISAKDPLDKYFTLFHYILNLLSRRELETTDIELKAMAMEAKMGFSKSPKKGYKTPMATGISDTLYPKAQNRFILIVLMVFLESSIADATDLKSLLISVISPASIATSVPVPMAIPTSAAAKAGASLMPSPTMATMLVGSL